MKVVKHKKTGLSILLILLLAPLLWINTKESFHWGDDYAQYLLQAKNIAQDKSQAELIVPGIELYSPPLRTIGYPIVLSVILPENTFNQENYLQFFGLLIIVCGLVLFRIFSNHFNAALSIILVLVTFYFPGVLILNGELLPEIPLLFFCYLSIYFYQQRKTSWAILFLSAAMLVKPETICLSAAFLVNEVFQNSKANIRGNVLKNFVRFMIIPCVVFYLVNKSFGVSMENIFWLSNRFESAFSAAALMLNIENYHRVIVNSFTIEAPNWVNFFARWSMLLFFLTGLATRIKKINELDLFFILYLLLILIYPYPKADFKFLLLIFPLVVFYIASGVIAPVGFIFKKTVTNEKAKKISAALAGIYFIAWLISTAVSIRLIVNRETGEQEIAIQHSFEKVAAFIHHNVQSDETVLFSKPWLLQLYAEKKALPVRFADESISVRQFISIQHPGYALKCMDINSPAFSQNLSSYLDSLNEKKIIYSDSLFALYQFH